MWFDTCTGGGGGGGVRGNFEKMAQTGLSVPKYAIVNLQINNFKDNKSTTANNIRHIFSSSNPDVHVKKLHNIRGSDF